MPAVTRIVRGHHLNATTFQAGQAEDRCHADSVITSHVISEVKRKRLSFPFQVLLRPVYWDSRGQLGHSRFRDGKSSTHSSGTGTVSLSLRVHFKELQTGAVPTRLNSPLDNWHSGSMQRKPTRPVNEFASWSNTLCIWRDLPSVVHFLGNLNIWAASRLWTKEAMVDSLLGCFPSRKVGLLYLADLALECGVSGMKPSKDGIPRKFCPASQPRVDSSIPGPLKLVIWTTAPPQKHSFCPLCSTIDSLGLTLVTGLTGDLQTRLLLIFFEVILLVRTSYVRLYTLITN